MPVAELVAIGTELLLGEIQDTNTRYLARCLRDVGIDLYRATLIGDNSGRIAALIREALNRADIVITTGGLGPTVDDPTRQAVADSFGVPLEFRPELWEQILGRFKLYGRTATENNRRQAYIPSGAFAIENKVGTAPGFIYPKDGRVVVCLPGVPREMEYLIEIHVLPYLRQSFNLCGIIKATVLHTAGIGESQVDELIGDLETLENPTVGLLAHPGQVDIRLTAKAGSVEEANVELEKLAIEVYKRLGIVIYGKDEETLESVIRANLDRLGWKLAVIDCGLNGQLVNRLNATSHPAIFARTLHENSEYLPGLLRAQINNNQAQAGIAATLIPAGEKHILEVTLITPAGENQTTRFYAGPPGNAPAWGTITTLDLLRREIISF